jgi:hypothetical protein
VHYDITLTSQSITTKYLIVRRSPSG